MQMLNVINSIYSLNRNLLIKMINYFLSNTRPEIVPFLGCKSKKSTIAPFLVGSQTILHHMYIFSIICKPHFRLQFHAHIRCNAYVFHFEKCIFGDTKSTCIFITFPLENYARIVGGNFHHFIIIEKPLSIIHRKLHT